MKKVIFLGVMISGLYLASCTKESVNASTDAATSAARLGAAIDTTKKKNANCDTTKGRHPEGAEPPRDTTKAGKPDGDGHGPPRDTTKAGRPDGDGHGPPRDTTKAGKPDGDG